MADLTSANAIIALTVANLFPAPVTLDHFGADRAFETEAIETAETVMTIDGHLAAGYVPNPVNQTFTLLPGSSGIFVIETLVLAQQTAKTIYRLGGTIVLPGISRQYSMNNGVLMSSNPIPNAGRILEARTFTVRWESVVGTPI